MQFYLFLGTLYTNTSCWQVTFRANIHEDRKRLYHKIRELVNECTGMKGLALFTPRISTTNT